MDETYFFLLISFFDEQNDKTERYKIVDFQIEYLSAFKDFFAYEDYVECGELFEHNLECALKACPVTARVIICTDSYRAIRGKV